MISEIEEGLPTKSTKKNWKTRALKPFWGALHGIFPRLNLSIAHQVGRMTWNCENVSQIQCREHVSAVQHVALGLVGMYSVSPRQFNFKI